MKRIEVYARVLPTVRASILATKHPRSSPDRSIQVMAVIRMARGTHTLIASHFSADDIADLAAGGKIGHYELVSVLNQVK